MTDFEVTAYCQRLRLSSRTKEVLAANRNTPHRERNVGPEGLIKGLYVPVPYPCRKIARVIERESVTCELAFLMRVEHDSNV